MGQLATKRNLPIFVHSELDDLGLTSKAFRVYGHLARRAGKHGAFPSYLSIGKACFGPDYPEAKPATWKRLAITAVAELVTAGLIRKENRRDPSGSHTTNIYFLTQREQWPGSDNAPAGDNAPGGSDNAPAGDNAPKSTPIESTTLLESSPPDRRTDPEYGAICKAYENEIGLLTELISDDLKALVNDFPAQWIVDAIQESARANVRKLNYAKSILNRWKNEGRNANGKPTTYNSRNTGEQQRDNGNNEIDPEPTNAYNKLFGFV